MSFSGHGNWKVGTADGTLVGREGLLLGCLLTSGGTAAASVTFYDGTGTAGRKLFTLKVAGTADSKDLMFTDRPERFKTALYADLTGTDAEVAALIS